MRSPLEWLRNLPEYEDMVRTLGPYDPNKDYVGAEGDWKSKHIPREILGVDVNVCAYIHDYWYLIGGDKTDKFKADAMFFVDMVRLLEAEDFWWLKRMRSLLRALTYFYAVRQWGDGAFNWK